MKKWTERLGNDVYNRLCHCCTKIQDLPELVNAKWAQYRVEGKDKKGFTKEDALIDVLELLDCNGIIFDLTVDEYENLCR